MTAVKLEDARQIISAAEKKPRKSGQPHEHHQSPMKAETS